MSKKFAIIVIFLSLLLSQLEAKVPIKNLYIFIEPTTVPNHLNDKGKESNDILYNSKKIALKIIKWAKKEKIKRVIVNGEILKKEINPALFMHKLIKKSLLKKRLYNIGKLLGNLHMNFLDYELTKENALLVYIGDVNFVKKDINSHGAYLSMGWLKNQNSPFVRKFLKADNSSLKDVPMLVVTRTQLSLKNEKKREDFMIKLFSDAGLKLFYIGNAHMAFGGRVQTNHILEQIKLIAKNKLSQLTPFNNDDSQLCQIVYNTFEIPISGCGR